MPRYFFNLHDGEYVEDTEGVDLLSLEAVHEHALECARDIACADIHQGHLNLNHRIEVTDLAGEQVLTITFRDAFTVEGTPQAPRALQ